MKNATLTTFLGLSWILASSPVSAGFVTVDWDANLNADGVATGSLLGRSVNFTSTDGLSNGGITFAMDWQTSFATNDVPGIADAGVINEAAAVDHNPSSAGFASLSLENLQVTDPVLMFAWTDNYVQTFDFDDSLSIQLLDQFFLNSVTIDSGNVVRTNGGHINSPSTGFAIQLFGTFETLEFQTNIGLGTQVDSVGLTLGVEESNVQFLSVPEPHTGLMLIIGLGALTQFRAARSVVRDKAG